jgi:hypothetical protein
MDEPMNETPRKILTCRQEVLDYTGLSRYMATKFVRLGMPVLIVDGHWYAHPDNLDEFFRQVTRVSSKNLPDEVIDGEQ